MKTFLKVVFVLSLIFLAVFLYRQNYLYFPKISNPYLFVLSVLFILGGYLFDSKAWQTIIKEDTKVKYSDAFISSGKFIFSKYIPGKIWIILGKAGYIRQKYNTTLVQLTSYSFYYQIISLVCASVLGLVLLSNFIPAIYFLFILSFVLAFILLGFFSDKLIAFVSKTLTPVFKKEIALPVLSLKSVFQVLLYSFTNWTIWAFAFSLFLSSFGEISRLNFLAGFSFPISAVLGIIVLFAPGGIGFREGALVFLLVALGWDKTEAASLAVFSRIWFLLGEFLFFIFSFLLDLPLKKKNIEKIVI